MRILITNALIAYGTNFDIIEGELQIEGNKISYVGPIREPRVSNIDKIIDAKNNLLIPGFKNAHTHTAMTFVRSLADQYPLQEWLFNEIFPREAKLTFDDIYYFSLLGFMEYLRNGITSCFDMYTNDYAFAKASEETGFRSVISCSANDFGGMDSIEEDYLKLNNISELISYRLGIHAEYTTSLDNIRKLKNLSDKYNAPIYAHMSETKKEVEECVSRYGISPVALFEKEGLFKHGGGIYHGVWLSDEDIEILKNNNVGVVLNPSSNIKLASGVAPIKKLITNNISLGIGTDGAGSNNALDMFREMYLATCLPNLSSCEANTINPKDILRAATVGGATIMGLNDNGSIMEGMKADIVMIDLNSPNMRPHNRIIENLVFSGNPSNVLMTIVNGQILYDNGCYTTIDKEKVIYSCEKNMEKFR